MILYLKNIIFMGNIVHCLNPFDIIWTSLEETPISEFGNNKGPDQPVHLSSAFVIPLLESTKSKHTKLATKIFSIF